MSFVESKNIIASHKRLQQFNEETDLIGVRKLIHKTIEACYSAYFENPVVEYFKEFYNNENIRERAKNGYTLVYSIDGKIVGTGSLSAYKINALFIDPALQRRGIGRRIMYSLFAEAEARNIKSLQIFATPGSDIFCQHLGFQIISEERVWVENIFPLDFYVMEKRLP